MKPFRFIAILSALALPCACTLIHIEGNSNSVTETGGHTGTLKVPTLSPEVMPAQ
jgi:hypothetical protein